MKQYIFQVVIEEDSNEFWEEINNEEKTGCDEVLHIVKHALHVGCGLGNAIVKLVEFSDGE